MFEMLAYTKKTENKYRWDSIEFDTVFSLYIPKWRVPEPKPSSIYVNLFNFKSYNKSIVNYSKNDIEIHPELRNRSIVSVIKWTSEHTKTARFDPIIGLNDAEIGSPYIPFDLLPDRIAKELVIEINWK